MVDRVPTNRVGLPHVVQKKISSLSVSVSPIIQSWILYLISRSWHGSFCAFTVSMFELGFSTQAFYFMICNSWSEDYFISRWLTVLSFDAICQMRESCHQDSVRFYRIITISYPSSSFSHRQVDLAVKCCGKNLPATTGGSLYNIYSHWY